jgi:hypothetical protein
MWYITMRDVRVFCIQRILDMVAKTKIMTIV